MINFQTDLLPINPAYNNSIVRYSSSTTGMTKSEITVDNQTFTVYPINELFTYNFKDIATTLINLDGFRDTIIPDLDNQFIHSDSSLQLTLSPQIKVMNSLSSETVTRDFIFSKSVEQLPFYYYNNSSNSAFRVLLPSSNSFDYSVTYFEGYPFDFAIRGIRSGDSYFFRNTNTGMVSDTFYSEDDDVKRIYLSDGANNETLSQVLVMMTISNPVEIWVNNVLKANIQIRRIESKCGVYLKWFNNFGSYSYWLFDSIYKETHSVKELDELAGGWDNLQNIFGTSESLGKTSSQQIELNTNFSTEEKGYLTDITTSPKVEIYLHQTPFEKTEDFKFLGVLVSGGNYPFNNKTSNNKLKINLELPAINTITY